MNRRIRVYIAGPYTNPDPCENTNKAIQMWNTLWDAGFSPFCPHLSHFLHTMHPRPYQEWLDYDMDWVKVCDVLIRMPGMSSGADKEVLEAMNSDVPVVFTQEELMQLRATIESGSSRK